MSSIAMTAPIFRDEPDRQRFLETLEEACGKTGWQVHAWCLMGNHFHLVLETPQANLVAGMKWFLGHWSSYGEYLKSPGRRQAWLRVDRLWGEMGIRQEKVKMAQR